MKTREINQEATNSKTQQYSTIRHWAVHRWPHLYYLKHNIRDQGEENFLNYQATVLLAIEWTNTLTRHWNPTIKFPRIGSDRLFYIVQDHIPSTAKLHALEPHFFVNPRTKHISQFYIIT